MKKTKMLCAILLSLFGLSFASPTVQAYGPISPSVNYNQTRVLRVDYLSNSQLKATIRDMRAGLSNGSIIGVVAGALVKYSNIPYAVALWIGQQHVNSLQYAADTGRGVKVITYEKVNWDGYSPRVYRVFYYN
ncbi:hypothetical protein [Streptococcus suis]|uniref:hypothetical protein n=1 Tax=Streptococcus suis TaxID=1307 RepID=UPI0004625EDD|nr:hypothetical protein [Streptococcus suis]ANC99188.1 hypothetical protein A6M16_01160 [Streptococcus suis]AOM73908.1 hypothetical protein BFP66_01050 [Streptococcus suis]MBL6515284.1 hypothetical protein [Streptococcus suis]MBS8058325.1 hypothetical protein [Streptococcus suis]MBS8113425.1 hypothetical protein [Streptococcus suis]